MSRFAVHGATSRPRAVSDDAVRVLPGGASESARSDGALPRVRECPHQRANTFTDSDTNSMANRSVPQASARTRN
jgi:hypothetical protein